MDFNIAKIKLIIGLGNPDEEYADTYHNIGHLAVDFLNQHAETNETNKLMKLKAKTYMNESGRFVLRILKKSGVKPTELLIIHDDIDIELGKYKISFGRGSAGHKGVESIIKYLKTKKIWRLRIGIAKQPADAAQKIKAEELVLKKINRINREKLNTVFKEIQKKMKI